MKQENEAFETEWWSKRVPTGCSCEICHNRELAVWQACEEHMSMPRPALREWLDTVEEMQQENEAFEKWLEQLQDDPERDIGILRRCW